MKKHLYSTVVALIFFSFVCASCHKENVQPSKQNTNSASKVSNSSGNYAVASSSNDAAPSGGCHH